MGRAPPAPVPSVRPSLGCRSRQRLHRHGHLVVLVHALSFVEHWLRLVSIQLWAWRESEGLILTSTQEGPPELLTHTSGLAGRGGKPYTFHLSLGEDAGEHHHAERHCEDEDEGEGQGGGRGHDRPEQGQAEQLQGCEQVHTEGPNLGVRQEETREPRLLPSLWGPWCLGGPATFRTQMTLSPLHGGGTGCAFLGAYQRRVCAD